MMSKVQTCASLLLLASAAGGCDREELRGGEPEVIEARDGSYVSLSGTVAATKPELFVLDYGSGSITVEMDDMDWYAEGRLIIENDPVVVYGYIDHDLFEERTIEASSVYARDLGTQFYASGIDEEDFPVVPVVAAEPSIELRGTVKSVHDEEFQLDLGHRVIEVDTETLPYDPLDDEGYHRIGPGDRVSVVGTLESGLFSGQDLMAERLISLEQSGPASGDQGS